MTVDAHRSAGALAGMRVLEHGPGTAAAYCTKLLADLGAEVVKVEPPEGDPARHAGPFPPGRRSIETSGRFLYLGTGKQSVVIDPGDPADAERLARLVDQADVVVDDGPVPEVADRLAGRADRVVWCSVTPFGLTGPYAGYRAEHLNIAHAGGEGQVLPGGIGWTQHPERPPTQIGSDMAHFDAGANAAIAVLAAYHRLQATGRGQRIDVSEMESQVGLFRTRLVRWTFDGVEVHQRPNPYTSAGGMFECADGYVQILGPREDSWPALRGLDGGECFADERFGSLESRTAHLDELNTIIGGWCRSRTKLEIVAALGPIGFAVGAYSVPKDLVDSPQLQARRFLQTVDHPDAGPVVLPGTSFHLSATPVHLRPAPRLGSGTGFAPATVPAPDSGPGTDLPAPLDGVRVLDFTWAIAGPYSTMLLALLGAEVIRVESSKRPDVSRRGFSGKAYPPDGSPDYHTLNGNKRSLQIDLTTAAGLDVVKRLVPLSDVVVDNFRPGVMARFGLGHEALLGAHPDLVVASSSGNGQEGPESLYAGLASIFAAVGGVSEQTGYPDCPPTLIGESPDFRSGNLLAVAVVAALVHRRRTGQGQFIDLSSTEVMAVLAPDAFLAYTLGAPPLGRDGNRHVTMAPHGVYPGSGEHQWISIAVSTDTEWAALCRVIERPDWVAAYPDSAARKADEATIDEALSRWSAGRSAGDAFAVLQSAGVPSAPSFTNADLLADPHLAARGAFVDIEHPVMGVQRLPAAPWVLSDDRWRTWRAAPSLGQDNRYVLEALLGLTPAEIEALGDIFV